MKQLLAVSILALAATTAWAQAPAGAQAGKTDKTDVKRPASKAHILTRTEFDRLVAAPERVVIVDVRRPDELTAIGGFPAYLSIQLDDLEKYIAFIPKERTVVTVSNHAGRAGRAADLLSSKGFNVVGAIGVQDYEAQGGKLAKIAPKAAANSAPHTGS